ncbi:MAG: preprotein translocase subunit SecG [Janthinobacterium lividum]
MTTVLMTLHIILAVAMVGIILIQKNEGGLGMGSGAMGSLMSTRGTTNLLTRLTGILATLFFLTTLGLAIVFKGANKPQSIFDASTTVTKTLPSTTPVPVAPTTPLSTPAIPSKPVQEGRK